MYASDGNAKITEFWDQNREVVPLKKISKYITAGRGLCEDRRFFTHGGVDAGVFRAFVQTWQKGDHQEQFLPYPAVCQKRADSAGRSRMTIRLRGHHASEDTIARKLREMLISVQMEKQYSKPEILQGYLNIAQFGGNSAVVQAALRTVFQYRDQLNISAVRHHYGNAKNPNAYDPSGKIQTAGIREATQHRAAADARAGLYFGCGISGSHPRSWIRLMLTYYTGCMAADYDAGYFCDYVVHKILDCRNSARPTRTRKTAKKVWVSPHWISTPTPC